MAFICHILKVVVGGFWKRSIPSAEGPFVQEGGMKMRGRMFAICLSEDERIIAVAVGKCVMKEV